MHHNVFGCGSKLLGNNHVMKLIPKNLEIANSTWNYVLPHRNSPQARNLLIVKFVIPNPFSFIFGMYVCKYFPFIFHFIAKGQKH